jgi:hypothetical protein
MLGLGHRCDSTFCLNHSGLPMTPRASLGHLHLSPTGYKKTRKDTQESLGGQAWKWWSSLCPWLPGSSTTQCCPGSWKCRLSLFQREWFWDVQCFTQVSSLLFADSPMFTAFTPVELIGAGWAVTFGEKLSMITAFIGLFPCESSLKPVFLNHYFHEKYWHVALFDDHIVGLCIRLKQNELGCFLFSSISWKMLYKIINYFKNCIIHKWSH